MGHAMNAQGTISGVPGRPGELIVRALSTVQFATTEQLTSLLYSQSSLSWVRSEIAKLRKLHLIKSIKLPQHGSPLPVHTLASRGITLSQELGYPVVPPYDGRDTLLFLPHQLAVTDVIVALTRWSRGGVVEIRHERVLKRLGYPAIPDVWVRLKLPDGKEAAIWFELERSRKSRKQIRSKVEKILDFAQEGYTHAFDAKSLTIAVVCVHGIFQAQAWLGGIEAELESSNLMHAADLFRVSGREVNELFQRPWIRPGDRASLPLVEV